MEKHAVPAPRHPPRHIKQRGSIVKERREGSAAVGRGSDRRRAEQHTAPYVDGKGHRSKSNLGNGEEGSIAAAWRKHRLQTHGTEREMQFHSRVNATDRAVETFGEPTKWNRTPSTP